MKTTFGIIFIIVLCSFDFFQKSLLKKVNIGKHSYSIYTESKYLHDNRWNAEFLVLYKTGTRRRLCSSFLKATRNDSTFVDGTYEVYDNRIEFIEHYHYNKLPDATDSIRTKFYPDKSGKLILKQAIIFTSKQKIIKKY